MTAPFAYMWGLELPRLFAQSHRDHRGGFSPQALQSYDGPYHGVSRYALWFTEGPRHQLCCCPSHVELRLGRQ
ncbi:hypothetical protein V2G26_008308 [Clonostachys chloroleuca]